MMHHPIIITLIITILITILITIRITILITRLIRLFSFRNLLISPEIHRHSMSNTPPRESRSDTQGTESPPPAERGRQASSDRSHAKEEPAVENAATKTY
ncbi:hypothetical protein Dda_6114 [Drechslerella dactyloides]|uniref:Uncharacterized protein n=1 Tax=Drechslerella dactyloides TaxID=74499 RepID=A0AAD6IZ63_DREDA|nr:hypothetical protein Dda_6114 [Drechslerella dactyloides]